MFKHINMNKVGPGHLSTHSKGFKYWCNSPAYCQCTSYYAAEYLKGNTSLRLSTNRRDFRSLRALHYAMCTFSLRVLLSPCVLVIL